MNYNGHVQIKKGQIVGYICDNHIKTLKVKCDSKIVAAQLLYPYLGTNYKHIWQPKIGTIVLVFFPCDVSDHGIVLGYLEKNSDESLLPFSDEGDKELFQHENGSKVELKNSENDRKIKISTPKEDEINIDLDGQCLEVKNQDGSLYISFDFKESKILLKANELSAEVANNINLKVSDIKVEASNSFELKSGSIKIKSNQDININATATTNIKGQTINLN